MRRAMWYGFLAVASACLSAQEAPTPTPRPPVKFRVVCLSSSGQIGDVKLKGGEDWIPLRIPSSFLPRPVDYLGPNPLTFWVERPAEEGGTTHVQVAEALIPEGAEELLFIFGPKSGSEERPNYRVTILDFSGDEFPEGSFYLINATDQRIAGTVGGRRIELNPNQRQVVSPGEEGGDGVVEVALAYPGRRKSMISTVWFHHATNRELIVFSDREDDPDAIVIQPFNFL